LEWGGNKEGLRKGRSVYKKPGTEVDKILSQQGGFQVSKEDRERGVRGNQQREKEARGKRHMYSKPKCVHNDCV
jgi:hypothetical protein